MNFKLNDLRTNAIKKDMFLFRFGVVVKAFLLPLLVAVFPPLFFYGNNIVLLKISSLGHSVLFYSVVAVVVFSVYVLGRRDLLRASTAASVFLFFFGIYGIIYYYFLGLDLVQIEHYTLFPLFFLFAMYVSYFISKISPNDFWKGAFTIVFVLVAFNSVKIVIGEIEKNSDVFMQQGINDQHKNVSTVDKNAPDIYFIIFDEFAGLDAARKCWNYEEIDEFVHFVEVYGFYVIENSLSSSTVTLHQLAERLNYQRFPVYSTGSKDLDKYYELINNSRVLDFLKSKGYKIVTFDETRYWYDTYSPMPADYVYDYDKSNNPSGLGIFFDKFGVLLADKTMLLIFQNYYQSISVEATLVEKHREFIWFAVNQIGELDEIPSPKFIRVHLILPHNPFMFDENGNETSPTVYNDWNYYFGQYKYTLRTMEKMIANILSSSSSENPPVIIIQSDHGARTGEGCLGASSTGYATHILNLLLIPGISTSTISQDMDPINTFPLIFNHFFDTDIPLE